MDIDLKDGTITFRLVYAGPRGATKFLNLRGLQSTQDNEAIAVLHADGDRVITFKVPKEEPERVLGLRVRFEAVAAPGEIRSVALEQLLLLAADVIVFLPEREQPAGQETHKALTRLVSDLETIGRDPTDVPILIQDYVDGEPRLEPRQLDAAVMNLGPRFLAVKGDTPDSTRMVFDAARDIVIERIQKLVEDLGENGARDALLQRVAERERALDEARTAYRTDAWWKAVIAAAIGAAAAGAFLTWLL